MESCPVCDRSFLNTTLGELRSIKYLQDLHPDFKYILLALINDKKVLKGYDREKNIKNSLILVAFFLSDKFISWYTEDVNLLVDNNVTVLEFLQIFKLAKSTYFQEYIRDDSIPINEIYNDIHNHVARACIELNNIYAFNWMINTEEYDHLNYVAQHVLKATNKFIRDVEKEIGWFKVYYNIEKEPSIEECAKLLIQGCGDFYFSFIYDVDYEELLLACIESNGFLIELPLIKMMVDYTEPLDLLEKYKDKIRKYNNTQEDFIDLEEFFSDYETAFFVSDRIDIFEYFCGTVIREYLYDYFGDIGEYNEYNCEHINENE